MAIARVATASAATGTVPLTVPAGDDRHLIVGVGTVGAQPSAVTYGGVALSLIGSTKRAGLGVWVELWGLAAPAVGTANVVVTAAGASAVLTGAVVRTGVDQAAPTGVYAGAESATAGPATVAVTAAADDAVQGVVIAYNGGALTATIAGGGAALWAQTAIEADSNGGEWAGAAPSVAVAWTLSAVAHWCVAGVALSPASGAAPAATGGPARSRLRTRIAGRLR